MKKSIHRILILTVMASWSISANAQANIKPATVILDYEDVIGRSISIYDDSAGNKSVILLVCDTINDDYPFFDLIGKSENRFHVIARYSLDERAVCTGWIDKDEDIVIGTTNYGWMKIWWTADCTGDFAYIYEVGKRYRVIDFEGQWLRIEGHDGIGQFFRGWISPTDQCSSVYSNCH